MITVPTTASRFALLQIDSDSDSEASDAGKNPTKGGRESSGKPRQGKAGGAGGKAGQCNDKKKDKKKKRKEQQLTEANEVRHRSICRPSASCLCYCAAGVTSVLCLRSFVVSLHLNWKCSWCCQVHSLVMVCLLFGDFHRLKRWDTLHTIKLAENCFTSYSNIGKKATTSNQIRSGYLHCLYSQSYCLSGLFNLYSE